MTVHVIRNRDATGRPVHVPARREARNFEAVGVDHVPAPKPGRAVSEIAETTTDGDELWTSYWRSGSLATRNELIERYMYLVEAVVRRLPSDVRRYWGEEDLKSFGAFGLIDAVERRQCELATLSFATYANTRIRGAIYDELRALDWLPRTARRKAIDFKLAEDALRVGLKRNPGYSEVLDAMKITSSTQSKATAVAVNRSQIASLDDRLNEETHSSRSMQLSSNDDVESELFAQIDRFELGVALATLPDRQRAILAYRYRDHLTLQQVGDLIGVSYSRICQIEQATLRDLRGMLQTTEVA